MILDLPSNSQTLNQRSFYTNLTRTKDQVVAFTDDREALFGAVTRENDKTMALDVEKENKEERRRATGREREASPETREMAEKTQTVAERTETMSYTTPERAQKTEKTAQTPQEEKKREEGGARIREADTPNGKEKTMERSEEKEYEHLTRQERERFDRWEIGQRLRFPQENKDLGMKAGEVAHVEKMDRETGVITLRKENGQEAKLVPEHTKREMERQKSMEEERARDQKTMEQGKEERKEEKREAAKEQERGREKNPFQDRPEERTERRQEKEREEKKEAPRIERQRGRDGMGY